MIYCYNPNAVGDVLLVVTADSKGQAVSFERSGKVARVYIKGTGATVGWNLFGVSRWLSPIKGTGQVFISEVQLEKINQEVKASDFTEELTSDNAPKLSVGLVLSCEKHPDSNHLSITQVDTGTSETLQIVCGAPNIQAQQKVVVARVGAMMPDGLIIWPGNLRGVASQGMICSARELGIPNAPKEKGILVLPEDAVIGHPFSIK